MRVHLVDATYELFRAHYAPRPPVLGRDGVNLSGVSGVVDQLLLPAPRGGRDPRRLRDGPGHRVVPERPVRRLQVAAGMPPELLGQFPIAEEAIEALGLVLWPMVEFEADDAIAAAAGRFAADPAVEQVVICTPDKDMAQLRRGERVVLFDRRAGITYDEAGVRAKWGVAPTSIPDWLALVGDSSDGFPGLPGWGAKSAAAVCSRATARSRTSRRKPPPGTCGLRGARVARGRRCGSTGTRRSCTGTSPGSARRDGVADPPGVGR